MAVTLVTIVLKKTRHTVHSVATYFLLVQLCSFIADIAKRISRTIRHKFTEKRRFF